MRFNRLCVLVSGLLSVIVVPTWAGSILTGNLSDASNFAVLYEGNGSNTLNINTNSNVQQYSVNGNVGLGDPNGSTPQLNVNNPGSLNGSALFAGTVNNVSNSLITGTVTGGNANVQTDLNNLNALSSTLGGETGASLTVNLNNNQSQTINASAGVLDGSGRRIFNVSSFNFGGGSTLTINGDAANDAVVLNFSSNVQFGGTILLTGGLTSDEVLFNVTGGANLTGGPTLQNNTNGAVLTGIFLDPNGAMSINDTILNGRFFGGDSSNMQIVSGGYINAPPPTPAVPLPSPLLAGTVLLAAIGLRRSWRPSQPL